MAEKKKTGRPTDYKPEYDQLAFNYSLLGATDVKMAEYFGVSEVTFNAWKKKHPSFLKSLKKGKEEADAEIAKALYHRAKGYSHPEDKIFNDNGTPLVVPTIKHYPPDTAAAFIWLKNRQKDLWRDQKNDEPEGNIGDKLTEIADALKKSYTKAD